ncbi:hypothetical protein BGZ80_008601 [Entomortierella chlamydospora]|uniref:Suppressor of white apricot N-terminal domain-containing protein n=1 Tax=Entomortierella chlamydospora TaxID=101097 RepID=A0A9P6MYJ7_9FUNG|nr:hypothetical protein BGZ80_008601 [Entomortierella chlamydospora]
MWKTVAKEEKRVKDLLENTKRRAQRRRAYYDSRLGDPMQLLRVSGSAVRLASTTVDSGLRVDRDEDGIGNELRFQRWHDLVDKARLQISEEQCLVENEEEWNDLVARHQALLRKVPEKKPDTSDLSAGRFAFNYGTGASEEKDIGRPVDQEVTALALEDENILERLDDLTFHERDSLDALGIEFHIQDYYRLLRLAKQEHDARVLQLKVNAVVGERTTGKKPLKSSEIEVMLGTTIQNKAEGRRKQTRRYGRPGRSPSPVYHSSESPNIENIEYIMEFQGDLENEPTESWDPQESLHLSNGMESIITTNNSHSASLGSTRRPHSSGADRKANTPLASSGSASIPSPVKMSLAEKLKQRMRQGLDMSIWPYKTTKN